MQSSSKRPSATTRHKGKEIAKPVTPQSESFMRKTYFKKLYKPTNNNLQTSSNSKNKTEDTTPRYNNDNQSGQFGNQRTMTVAGARETRNAGSKAGVKDYAYHKEKMMMCKQAEQGVPLQAEQADWLEDTDEEIDEQELEAHYSYMAKIMCVSKDVTCSYLHSMSHLNANTELQCLYLHKVKECECLAQKLSKQTESVNKEVHNKLLKSFAKLEKHSISIELSLQHCKEQMKNNPVCKENSFKLFRKEREQYHEIQDLKAQMQDKNMVINELKKSSLVSKGKSVETQFDKPFVVRQPNAQRIPKPSVLGKPTPFSNSPE
ncbi:hypothetical protein Tco_0394373 [Tanacetum coccineum]